MISRLFSMSLKHCKGSCSRRRGAQDKKGDREVKEQQVMEEKERAAALRGKIGFAKMVWKEALSNEHIRGSKSCC